MKTDPASIRNLLDDAIAHIPSVDEDSILGSADTGIHAGDTTLQVGHWHTGELAVFIPAPENTHCPEPRSGLDLQVLPIRTTMQEEAAPHLIMTCRVTHLEDTFRDLVAAIGSTLATSSDDPVLTIIREYTRWRELFDRRSTSGLTAPQEAGLVAELLTLSALIDESDWSTDPLDMWRGPDGARHDFTDGFHALEVKATIANTIDKVGIHGIEQLVAPPDGSLHLAVYRLEEGVGEVTVRALFESLRDTGIDVLRLRDKIMSAKFDLADQDSGRKWRVAGQQIHSVDDGFPRLTPASFVGGDVPAGVSNIQYSLSLATTAPLATADIVAVWISEHGGGSQ